ncbi:MAG TPA: DUF3078 domain-containing protein [Bacteroidales bacterium]|nr:DUF3078 domain-containing protein [Bacteroidales bacterium]
MKPRLIIIAIALVAICKTSFSQVTEAEDKLKVQTKDTLQGWRTGGVLGLSLAQTSLTNWSAGGQNSMAGNGILSFFANYKKDKTAWDNSFDFGYGLLKQGTDKDYKKTDDKIDILSKYGHEAFKNFYYAALFNFKTQMTAGYKYPTDTTKVKISDLFAPAYVVGALGMDYKPNAYLSVFAAPLTAKMTIVNNQALADAGAFGMKDGKKSKTEFGGYVRFIYSKNDFKNEALKNVSFTTKLDLFSNYAEDPQNIDVSWETQIAFKVNKYISVNVNTHLLYDDNIKTIEKDGIGQDVVKGAKIQFKEILGAGFSYNF